MPELGIRSDIVPEQETRVVLKPQKAGSFTFFCGDGHEDVDGSLIVEA